MKPVIKNTTTGLCLIFGLFGIGCNKGPISYENASNNSSTMSAKMKLPDRIPQDVFEYTPEDYKSMINSEIPVLAKRMSDGDVVIGMVLNPA